MGSLNPTLTTRTGSRGDRSCSAPKMGAIAPDSPRRSSRSPALGASLAQPFGPAGFLVPRTFLIGPGRSIATAQSQSEGPGSLVFVCTGPPRGCFGALAEASKASRPEASSPAGGPPSGRFPCPVRPTVTLAGVPDARCRTGSTRGLLGLSCSGSARSAQALSEAICHHGAHTSATCHHASTEAVPTCTAKAHRRVCLTAV